MTITDSTHQSTVKDKYLYSYPDYYDRIIIDSNMNFDLIHVPSGKV